MSFINTSVPQATQAPAVHTDAVCTMAAPAANAYWMLDYILFSYSAPPAAGSTLVITSTTITMTFYVGSADKSPDRVDFGPDGFRFAVGEAVTITLKDGGVGIYGTVYPCARTENN